ncbi:MAG: hypothetical protein WA970_21470 [Gammaproteobacteria bacterium]
MIEIRTAIALALLSMLSACADINSVLFVTDTKIAIDGDTKPPNVSIGYARDETFVGPNFENQTGSIPPVVGRLESNLAVFNPEISQVYATGRAATLVTGEPGELSPPRILAPDETKRLVFFRTGSNIGLKVVFAGNVPESITLGYKRKELSFIPLVRVVDAGDTSDVKEVYGSVLAAIDVNVNTPSLTDTALGVSQFFATGIAAEKLANANPDIRAAFQKIAAQAVVGATYDSSDPTVACVEAWLAADANRPQELQTWWEARGLTGFATLQIVGQQFKAEREAFIAERAIPCNP